MPLNISLTPMRWFCKMFSVRCYTTNFVSSVSFVLKRGGKNVQNCPERTPFLWFENEALKILNMSA